MKFFYTPLWGQQDIYWIAFYLFCEKIGCTYDSENQKLLYQWFELAKNCMWWYPFENYCFISEKPEKIIWNDTKEYLHSYTEPVVKFKDNWGIYCIDGIRVPKDLIENPELLSIENIEGEENAELKRVKIQVYENQNGTGAYLKDSGAELIHSDNVGRLYKKAIPGDEDMVMVRVKNSTINQDGSTDEYWLRVPPNIVTAKEAVAWTFDMSEQEYNPIIET